LEAEEVPAQKQEGEEQLLRLFYWQLRPSKRARSSWKVVSFYRVLHCVSPNQALTLEAWLRQEEKVHDTLQSRGQGEL
jgi:hypothetical protein